MEMESSMVELDEVYLISDDVYDRLINDTISKIYSNMDKCNRCGEKLTDESDAKYWILKRTPIEVDMEHKEYINSILYHVTMKYELVCPMCRIVEEL